MISLLDDFPRGMGTPGRVADARFATSDAIARSETLRFESQQNAQGKLFMGVQGGEVHEDDRLFDGRPNRWIYGGLRIGLPDDRHVCTIAGSRAGKGRSALIPNLLTYPAHGSLLVIDPKGDLARMTAGYRANWLGQSVAVLDPFRVAGDASSQFGVAFNPLVLLTNGPADQAVSSATLIADALVVAGNAKDPHWDDCARDMITGLCLHVATHETYAGKRDLVTVWELASQILALDPDNDAKCRIESEMEENPAGDGKVRAACRSFYDRSGNELSSVVSTLRKHLDWIGYEQIKGCLRGESIDLRDLKRNSMALYVSLPAMQMAALSGWLRLVVQMALIACEADRTVPAVPVLFMLDEFHVLGKLESLQTAIAQIAGFGVKLWIVLQDLGQLKKYDNWETFISNTGALQCFGNCDAATLEYLSKSLGSTQVINPSVSATSYDQAVRRGSEGGSFSVGTHPLMAPEEVGRFFGRDDPLLRQLILRPGIPPMVLQRAFYDKHELFRGRI